MGNYPYPSTYMGGALPAWPMRAACEHLAQQNPSQEDLLQVRPAPCTATSSLLPCPFLSASRAFTSTESFQICIHITLKNPPRSDRSQRVRPCSTISAPLHHLKPMGRQRPACAIVRCTAAGHGGGGGTAVQCNARAAVLQRDAAGGACRAGRHMAVPVVHRARGAGAALLPSQRPHRHVLGPG